MVDYPSPDDRNVAKAYETMDDASTIEIPTVKATEKIMSGAAAGLRTCTKDLLVLYDAFMTAANDQFGTGKTSTPHSPLKQVNYLMSAAVPMNGPTLNEASYGLGWARVQLPGMMGAIGCNPQLMLDGMPVVGKGVPSRLVIYHQGSLPGALSAVFLMSETRTAIVAMSNSLALNDCPDWVAQLVLEEILEVPKKNDYVEAARINAAQILKWYPAVKAELQKSQKHNTSAKDLEVYTWTYRNSIKTMKMVVLWEKGELYYLVQGLESEKYILTHYEDDVFTWIRPRNELAARGRWVDQGPEFWKIRFGLDADGNVDRLNWVHDAEVTEGETFFKSEL